MPTDETPGGLGGDAAPFEHGGIRDTRLYERAIRERWPMPPHMRYVVLKRLCKVLDEDAVHDPLPVPEHREVISAARALMLADRINLDHEKLLRQPAPAEDDRPAVDAWAEAESVADEHQPEGPPDAAEG